MDKLSKIQMILTRLKENSCLYSLGPSNHQKIKLDSTRETSLKIVRILNRAKKTQAKTVTRNLTKSAHKMLEHRSLKKSQLQTKTKLFNPDRLVKNLTIVLLNLHLQLRLAILLRIQIKLIKTHSLFCHILVSIEEPTSSLYVMVMV